MVIIGQVGCRNLLLLLALTEDSHLAEKYAAEITNKLSVNLVILHIIDTLNLHFDLNVSHIFPIDYVP